MALFLLAAHSGLGQTFELSKITDTLHVSGPGPYQLSRRPVIENSESVVLDSVLLTRDVHYRLNYRLGILTFKEYPSETLTAFVTYRFFPFALEERYFRNELSPSSEGEETTVEARPEKKEVSSAPSTLVVGGSKSLGVSVGRDGDVALEQALRVNISGMATEDVEVRAVLSDQSTPIQPEGTTEELEELDQVLLEIEGKNLSASFGDYDFAMDNSDFGRVERKLEGGMGEVRSRGASAMIAAARNRGDFASNRFWGVDGKQGPYQLTSPDGATYVVVVAGSEKVYLDGELKRRGESNDYVIDYSLGQVTFTTKVLITSRSRILVDFEYGVLDYRRSLYASSASYSSLGGRLLVGGSLMREGDDRDSPLYLTLTPERRQALEDAGDDSSLAWVSGGVYVGDSLGSYVKEDSVYRYVGYGQGDYSVSFTKVSAGEGDYQFDYGLGGYVFVGQNLGEYIAMTRLPLPAREQFHSVSAQYSVNEKTEARIEYAGSSFDRNTFSSIGDADNEGSAYDLSFDTGLGQRLSFKTRYKSWDERFRFPGRRSREDYEDFWNVRETEGAESVGEVEAGISPLEFLKFKSGFGRLRREEGKADRIDFGASFERERLPSLSYTYNSSENDFDTTGTRTRHLLTGRQRLGRFTPRASLFIEESSRKLSEGTGGLSFGARWLTGDISYAHRLDYARGTAGWAREAVVKTAKAVLEASGSSKVTGSMDLVHREKTMNEGFPGENSNYDLAGLRLKARPIEKRMSVEARYELTRTEIGATREIFYEVEKGTGDYSRDPITDEYYPDPDGDYRREVVQTGSYRPVSEVSSSLRLNTLPVDLVSIDGFVTLGQKSVRQERFSGYTFDFERFHDDSSTITGLISFQGDLNLFPYASRSLGVRAKYDDHEDNQMETAHMERERIELSLFGKAKLSSDLSGEVEVSSRSDERRSTEHGLEREEGWRKGRTTFALRPSTSLEPSITFTMESGEINEPYYYPALGAIPMTVIEFAPRLRYYLAGKGRVETNLSLTERRSEALEFPADVQNLYPVGLTTMVRSSFEYRLNEWLSSFVNHTVRKEPADRAEQSMRVEMRASF
jgi:hypothetical protein